MFWQKDLETLARPKLRELQTERMRKIVAYAYDRVPHYRKAFDEIGLKPEHIRTLEDVKNIPLTKKSVLRDNYPYGMYAVPLKEVVRIHASSGTTGKPTVVGYTRRDMDLWSDLIARLAVAVGVTDEDIAQISFGYGLFTGAFGLHQGLEKVGCSVIPMSSGNTEKQLMIMEDFQTSVLIATPSYAMYMSELVHQRGIRDRLKLRVGLFGAEGCTSEMSRRIEENFGIVATDNYGMSELMGPGVAGECMERCGLHFAEDHFYPEIIDPDTGEVLPEGEVGELVVTTLTKEALPILRYRTGDITRLHYEPCKCGRTHVRMEKVKGRSDDMLIIKGVNVFPSQVESVLMTIPEIGPHYQLVVTTEGLMDALQVNVELADSSALEKFAQLEAIQKKVHARLQSVLGLSAKINLVEPGTIERFQGKAKRVIDKRNR